MKTLHLATAILATISRFHGQKLPFSGYDVTTSLREKVRDSEYDISDVDRDTIGGRLVPVIEHKAVNEIVKELFSLDLIPDYQPENHHDVQLGKTYVKYSFPVAATPVAATPVAVSAAASAPTHCFVSGIVPSKIPATPVATGILNPAGDNVWDKVTTYIANQRSKGMGNLTMKQIQSRLKGYKITCRELVDGLAHRGFWVDSSLKTASKSVVKDVTLPPQHY